MSNVFRRKRKETELQFLKNAWDLQFELTKFVMREKYVPKKWRYMIAQGIINKVDELVDNLEFANCIYPQTKEDFAERRKYQTAAIANVWQLQNKIVRMIECVETVKVDNLGKVIELLESEEALIKKWKKSDKEKEKKLFADNS